jgi:polysaccharide pyruvyl transferase WcaK-like protein
MISKKILFFGLFGQKNWGNDCTLEAMIFHTRKHLPGWDLGCVCTDPADVTSRYGIPAFAMVGTSRTGNRWWGEDGRSLRWCRKVLYLLPLEMLHWVKVYRTLKGARMLVVPGTGLLTDFEGRIFSRCYEVFKWLLLAKLRRCKVFFVSMGAGPILHPLGRWFVKAALSMADYRSYRNDSSKSFLRSIGFDVENDSIYPDLAFSLPIRAMEQRENPVRQRPVVGVGVKDYYGRDNVQKHREAIYRDYIEKTCSFVIWLLDNRYAVRILIGDLRYDNNVKKDLKMELKNRGYADGDGHILDESIDSVEQLIAQLATTDVVVSPRFHNIILAMMLSKPVISLSYHEKFPSLMSEMGLAEYCQNIEELRVEKLIETFHRLVTDADAVKEHIKRKTEENRLVLEKQYQFMFADVRHG